MLYELNFYIFLARGRILNDILYVRYVHLSKAKPLHNRQTHLLVRDGVT
jgi:hypothetical protein